MLSDFKCYLLEDGGSGVLNVVFNFSYSERKEYHENIIAAVLLLLDVSEWFQVNLTPFFFSRLEAKIVECIDLLCTALECSADNGSPTRAASTIHRGNFTAM